MEISQEIIKEIRQKADLVGIASQYFSLQKKGDRYWACCPFHQEQTPSFSIYSKGETQFFHCFGCGKTGDVFNFVEEMEHISFYKAVTFLVKKLNLVAPGNASREVKNKRLFLINKKATNVYHWQLTKNNMADLETVKDYLAARKITEDTINRYSLGFAPKQKDFIINLLKKEFSSEDLQEVGLLSTKNDKGGLFANRIIFPIRDEYGRYIGFSARALGENLPKYINTPETEIYKKRDNLYGLYEAKEYLLKTGEAVLCEGAFDVLSFAESGILNAVATHGTAFTENQAKLLKKYCNKVILCFDSDLAGQTATEKAIFLCQKNSLDSEVVVLPYKDAGEILQKEGKEHIQKVLQNNSVSGFHFLVNRKIELFGENPKKIFDSLLPFLEATESVISRSSFIRELSERLNIPEWAVYQDYPQLRNGVYDKHE